MCMAKFKYKGPTQTVGRFGILKKGAVVELRQSEVDYITKHAADLC